VSAIGIGVANLGLLFQAQSTGARLLYCGS
jgi:hypothetical protein